MLPLLTSSCRFSLFYVPEVVEFASFCPQVLCWSTSWNSKWNFYFNFFSNNRNNQKVTNYNKKPKKKAS